MSTFLADLADLGGFWQTFWQTSTGVWQTWQTFFPIKLKNNVGERGHQGGRGAPNGLARKKRVYREKRSGGLPGLPPHEWRHAPRSATRSATDPEVCQNGRPA